MRASGFTFPGFQFLLVGLIALIALLAGLWLGGAIKQDEPPPPELERATVLGAQARPLPDFSLIDHQGKPFVRSSLAGHWTLMFFGYTFCPDICPMTLSTARQALNTLHSEGNPGVRVVFISVDPNRDTLERLSDYVTYFDQAFTGVTGPEAELARFARNLGVVYARAKQDAQDSNYLVDHSASMLLLNPKAELFAVFSAPHEPEILAKNLRVILAWN